VRSDLAESAKSYSLVVSYALAQLEAALEASEELAATEALEALIRAIVHDGQFTKSELEKLPALLDRVADKHFGADERNIVRQKLKSAKVMDICSVECSADPAVAKFFLAPHSSTAAAPRPSRAACPIRTFGRIRVACSSTRGRTACT
jgi:hypothetical protein